MTTQEQKRVTAIATIANDFMFKCFEKGMSSEQVKGEAVKHEKEILSRINGLIDEM